MDPGQLLSMTLPAVQVGPFFLGVTERHCFVERAWAVLKAESDHSPLCHVPREGSCSLPFWRKWRPEGSRLEPRADLLFVCINLHIASQCFQFKIRLEALPVDLQSLSLTRLLKSLFERNARGQHSGTSLLTLHDHTERVLDAPLFFSFFHFLLMWAYT